MNLPGRIKRLDKYAKIEIVFFIIFFFLFPVLTDIEYFINEAPCQNCDESFGAMLMRRFIFGLFNIPPYLFLYRFIIHRFLLRRKYLVFALAFIVFLFALNCYIVYCMYWPISKMSFLPVGITDPAGRWMQSKNLFHFSIVYVTNQALVFAALAYFTHFGRQEEKMNALKRAKLESDLNYLKAQVQPHFFFNTLNNIYSLAQQRSSETAPMVAKLADMMRYVIYETANQKVSLKNEIEFLRNYVSIEAIRYDAKIAVSFDVRGIEEGVMIEPLLLLPFVENVFKHGISNEMDAGFAEIVIVFNDGQLTLQTRNSKPAVKERNSNTAGIGMKNVTERLRLLYPGKHDLVVNDEEKKYEVIFTVQLN